VRKKLDEPWNVLDVLEKRKSLFFPGMEPRLSRKKVTVNISFISYMFDE
jgi:hypothetical protein